MVVTGWCRLLFSFWLWPNCGQEVTVTVMSVSGLNLMQAFHIYFSFLLPFTVVKKNVGKYYLSVVW